MNTEVRYRRLTLKVGVHVRRSPIVVGDTIIVDRAPRGRLPVLVDSRYRSLQCAREAVN